MPLYRRAESSIFRAHRRTNFLRMLHMTDRHAGMPPPAGAAARQAVAGRNAMSPSVGAFQCTYFTRRQKRTAIVLEEFHIITATVGHIIRRVFARR